MTITAALDLVVHHQFSVWDAVIVASAVEAGCRLLLSQDLSEGLVRRGLTIVNPFAVQSHPLLNAVLGPGARDL